mmetsp:Transcript_43132/g.136334  ORF Transcript_43132/g.136334 Transcript_43132/m.136334 type:complete len:213 (+) Transcript_43132:55-693(+)
MVGPCPQHRGARAPKLRGTNEECIVSRARPDTTPGAGGARGLSAQRGNRAPLPHWHLPARPDQGGKGIVGIDSNAEPGGSTAGAGDPLAPRERARRPSSQLMSCELGRRARSLGARGSPAPAVDPPGSALESIPTIPLPPWSGRAGRCQWGSGARFPRCAESPRAPPAPGVVSGRARDTIHSSFVPRSLGARAPRCCGQGPTITLPCCLRGA